jgi:hypothetical protein
MSRCACPRCQQRYGLELIVSTLLATWEETKWRGDGETVPAPIAASLERLERIVREPPASTAGCNLRP